MTEVLQSRHCCAVYELDGLTKPVVKSYGMDATDKQWEDMFESLRVKAKNMGMPHALPLVFVFTDGSLDEDGKVHLHGAYGHVPGSMGYVYATKLKALGYRVDRHYFGKNPKTGNHINLYYWHTHKNKKAKDSVNVDYAKGHNIPRRTGVRKPATRRV